jgi:4-diphosphocytidyl-2-C-methyl-D-erythritol kinase
VAGDPAGVLSALRGGAAKALGQALGNDLQAAALSLRPELGRILEVGTALGALGGLVSGSGPTVAFLARDEGHAAALAAALPDEAPCASVRVATGPVHGARVVRSS